MNELRFDPTAEEWVIIAEDRGKRPHAFRRRASARAATVAEGDCPFCPGHEAETPPEIDRVSDAVDAERWLQRVVPNRFAALSPSAAALPGSGADGERERLMLRGPAWGAHEVIIETDRHDSLLHTRDESQLQGLFELYQRRVRAHALDPRVEAVSLFKNEGPEAGASLPHPHSQLLALPWLPALWARRLEIARRGTRARGHSLYARLRDDERHHVERVVFEHDGFIAFAPFASTSAFELWIMPLVEQAAFLDADAGQLRAAGCALARALRALFGCVGPCSYNALFHVGTPVRSPDPAMPWFMQVVPRLTKRAGFELSSGVAINPVAPESAAAQLRRALAASDGECK